MTVMKITGLELEERLAEADRMRALLRRATIELRELGEKILAERQQDGSERPDDSRASDG